MRIDLLNGVEGRSVAPRRAPTRAPNEPVREHWRIGRALRSGQLVDDRVFDEVFPLEARARSSLYWTPVEVAVRAANLLADRSGATILDIGSGIGKFCIVAAAAVNADVRGLEHRPHFIEVARQAAAEIGVTPTFHGGAIDEQDAAAIDGFYLFNPFGENLCSARDRLDGTVELNEDRFWSDVAATARLLARARVGARVVTYCGYGGEMPADFVRVMGERCGGGRLELWIKQAPAAKALPRTKACAARGGR